MKQRRNYEELGDIELDEKTSEKVEAMVKAADDEDSHARVNFRWSREALDVVKKAAQQIGIPYQTFIKQTVYEHSLSVIKDRELLKR
jgi:predicted DNA binding CopG/RHH family protein